MHVLLSHSVNVITLKICCLEKTTLNYLPERLIFNTSLLNTDLELP